MPKKNLLVFCLLLCFAGRGQSFPSDSTFARVLQSDVLLPLLIDSALKNSPDLKRTAKNVKVFEQNLQTTKKSILNSISLGTAYGYGTSGNLALEKDPSGTGQLSNFSSSKNSRYNVGFSIQVPIGSFLSRKNIKRTAELQIEMAEDEMDNTTLQIKREVIKLYQEMKLAHAILVTVGKMKQGAYATFGMAQKNFTDGQTTLDQFSKLQNEYNQAIMDFDSQVNKFQTSFLILEAFTGVQLTKLINRIL